MTAESDARTKSETLINRIRSASRELHHTYAVNWTTTILTLGLALFVQVLGIAAKHEHRQGSLSSGALEGLLELLLVAQVVLVGFWLLLCIQAWLGRPAEVN